MGSPHRHRPGNAWVGLRLLPPGGRGEPWECWADAESAGFSEAGLQDIVSHTETLDTTGLVVVKGGKVLLEYGDIEARGYMAAGRYSVAAMVFGKPVRGGTIDLDLTLFQAIGEDLGYPLGLQDFNWKRQNPGHERTRSYFTVYNLYLSTRDVARFGQLMLQEGAWRGEQLIPREWVEQMTTIVTPAEELYPEEYRSRGMGFGYMWWIWQDPDPEGTYVGAYPYTGSYGQHLTVHPIPCAEGPAPQSLT